MPYLPDFHCQRFQYLPMVSLLATAICVEPLFAVERIYSIVTNQSSIAISGTVTSTSLGTATVQQQGPGSLVTSYTGSIHTDRGPNVIQFLTGATVDANLSGNWQPRSNASSGATPADYGGQVLFGFTTLFVAAQDVVGDLTSGVLSVSSGNFNLSAVNLTFTNGNIAYRDSFGIESGFRPLIGESGTLSGTGSLNSQAQSGGILETLTIPVNSNVLVTTSDGSINLTLTGQVVATAMLPPMLVGDYNQNRTVDAADYVMWRNNFPNTLSLPNDDTPGVDLDDYTRWRSLLGNTAGVSAPQAVPEPECILLMLTAIIAGLAARRWPSQNRPHARRIFL